MEPTDFTKLTNNIKIFRNSSAKIPIVLVLSGSFNPIHIMHVEMLEFVKLKLDISNSMIVGGFIAPSSDAYVKKKLGKYAISLKDRCKMVDLATQASSWITSCGYGQMSSSFTKSLLASDIKKLCPNIIVKEVCGADYIINLGFWKRPIICVGRNMNDENTTKKILDKKAEHHKDFVFLENDMDIEYKSISSTKIRNDLKSGELHRLKNVVHDDVITYILGNCSNLL